MTTKHIPESAAILGWHFVGHKLRDGRPVPNDGVTLEHNAPIEWCQSGLYSSCRIIDALGHAPGHTICRVQSWGTVEDRDDGNEKIAATRRRILWRVDAASLLRDFSRQCALDVVDLWDCPDVVGQYLKTGDKTLRKAAWAAARAAAWATASNVVRAAARAAAKAAARETAWNAVWDAARDAARDAAWAAARDAAWNAVWDAAGDAAGAAAKAAAKAAARDAAWAAARDSQNKRLEAMVQLSRARVEFGAEVVG